MRERHRIRQTRKRHAVEAKIESESERGRERMGKCESCERQKDRGMNENGGEKEGENGITAREKDYKNANVKIRTGACTLISASRAFFIVFPVMRQAGLKTLAIV